jgi:hypothetical protein
MTASWNVTRPALFAATLFLLAGCGSSSTPGSSGSTSVGASSSSGTGGAGGEGGGGTGGEGGSASPLLDAILADLLGDFDNSAQHAMMAGKLVERHVCVVPGRADSASVLWIFVEQIDDTSGQRETYSTRVHEIRLAAGKAVARVFKLAATHPLADNPYALDGARDGCTKPALLQAITDADLLYRDGCDLTFAAGGSDFVAATDANSCAVPGGFINTSESVSPGGLTQTDTYFDAASKKSQPLSALTFVRLAPKP